MEADGKTRLFASGDELANQWVQEIYPQTGNDIRFEGDADTEVRLRLDAICIDDGERWLVNQVIASAYLGPSFEVGKITGNEEGAQYPVLAEALEHRLGATGLTVLVHQPSAGK